MLHIYCQFMLSSRVLHTCNNCVAVALFSGFFTKHWLTKSTNDGDHTSGFRNVGGGLVGIMKMAWKMWVCKQREILNITTSKLFFLHKSLWHLKYHTLKSKILHRLSHPHGMYVSVGRLPLCHLYSGYSQRPDVSHAVVADLLYDLWSHPEWRADDCVSLRHGVLKTRGGGRSTITLIIWITLLLKSIYALNEASMKMFCIHIV